MRLTFEIDGKAEFDRAAQGVSEHLSDLRPVWPEVKRSIQRIEREQFASEGAKGRSGKWKPLSRAYAQRKGKRYGAQPILRASGKLERSLTGETADTILIEEPLEFGFGTRLFYAVFHQRGTSKMPAREVFSFSEQQRTDLMKGLQKGLLKVIRGDRRVARSMEVEG